MIGVLCTQSTGRWQISGILVSNLHLCEGKNWKYIWYTKEDWQFNSLALLDNVILTNIRNDRIFHLRSFLTQSSHAQIEGCPRRFRPGDVRPLQRAKWGDRANLGISVFGEVLFATTNGWAILHDYWCIDADDRKYWSDVKVDQENSLQEEYFNVIFCTEIQTFSTVIV